MLNVKIEKGSVEKLVVTGGMLDIIGELCLEIALIYSSFEREDKHAAKIFKDMMTEAVEKKVFNGNILDEAEDDDDEVDEDDKKHKMTKAIEALQTLAEIFGNDGEDGEGSDENKRFRA